MSQDDRERWWSVAREHNVGLDAALRRAEAGDAALAAVERVRALCERPDWIDTERVIRALDGDE